MSEKHYTDEPIRVHRIDRTLMNRLSGEKGDVGTLVKTWPAGFLSVNENGRPIYFFSSQPLHVPFGVGLKGSVTKWLVKTAGSIGDHLIIQDSMIYFPFARHLPIQVNPKEIVELRRQWPDRMPDIKEQDRWVRILVDEIFQYGCLDGLGEMVSALSQKDFKLHKKWSFRPGTLSEFACRDIYKLMEAAIGRDIDMFGKAFKGLVGMGPGMTPSGDDFLVGFFAAHQMFCSALVEEVGLSQCRDELITHAYACTTPVSAELIHCALDGYFSENLYEVVQSLAKIGTGPPVQHAIQSFLGWGSTSGTDTLAGLAFGLRSLN